MGKANRPGKTGNGGQSAVFCFWPKRRMRLKGYVLHGAFDALRTDASDWYDNLYDFGSQAAIIFCALLTPHTRTRSHGFLSFTRNTIPHNKDYSPRPTAKDVVDPSKAKVVRLRIFEKQRTACTWTMDSPLLFCQHTHNPVQ